jgi:tetrahydrodipicolinate N-succinyltransferase
MKIVDRFARLLVHAHSLEKGIHLSAAAQIGGVLEPINGSRYN